MATFQLPNGVTGFTYDVDEVTERMSRKIERARNRLLPLAVRLADEGYVEPIPEDWPDDKRTEQLRTNLRLAAGLSDSDNDASDDYQTTLIQVMVKSWSLGEVTEDAILDLPKASFEALAEKCDEVLRGTVVDADVNPDPKAPAAS